jgi:hypothetical protein
MAYRMPTPDPYGGRSRRPIHRPRTIPGTVTPGHYNSDPMGASDPTDVAPDRFHPHPDPAVVNHPGLGEEQNRRGLLLALAVKRAQMAAQSGQEIGANTRQRLGQLHSPLAGALLEGKAQPDQVNTLVSFLSKAIGRARGRGASRYGGLF